jgi:DNA-binding transcriptional LysR family regulator
MTLEQLRIFIAVAETEHVTRAAAALNITQSAASAAIAALETRHGVRLFDRVGRRIELTEAGRMFLGEARGVLDRAADAELALSEYGGLRRGTLRIAASHTIAGYWLPRHLAAFHALHPDVTIDVAIANTEGAADQVMENKAELGFIEGSIDAPALAQWTVARDRMVLIAPEPAEAVDDRWLRAARWIMREPGSGTRSSFEAAMAARGIDPSALHVVLTLPSNEAVRSAVEAGAGCAVLSAQVVARAVMAGTVRQVPLALPEREFLVLRHKERYRTKAADALLGLLAENGR